MAKAAASFSFMRYHTERPDEWTTYFKLCGIVAGVYCALIGCIVAWEKWKEREELKKFQKANQEEYEI